MLLLHSRILKRWMDCARIWTSSESHWFTSDKVFEWHQGVCYVCPDVTERRISYLQTTLVLHLHPAFWEETYPAPKSTPDVQQAALLTAHEKPTRKIFWKCCNLLLLKLYSLCFCQESLAWLYFSFVCWSRAWERNGHQATQVLPSPWSQCRDSLGTLVAAQAGRAVCHSPEPSPIYRIAAVMEPSSLPALPYWSRAGSAVCMWSGLNSEYFILLMERVTVSYARHEVQGCREITRR